MNRAGDESARAEAKFRALLESAPDAMVTVDGEGRIHLVRPSGLHIDNSEDSEVGMQFL